MTVFQWPHTYPIELEIKNTTDAAKSVSYLDLHIEIDSDGRLKTKLYDKRDYFSSQIVNFPFLCSNIPAASAYGVYISQLIQYAWACISCHDFLAGDCTHKEAIKTRVPNGEVEIASS